MKELTTKEIGNRLKLLRMKAGLSQEEVASGVGTSQNLISRIEAGQGTLEMCLNVLNFFGERFNIDNFLAANYTLDSIITGPSLNIMPLESVAAERLAILKEEINKELDYSIKLLKGS